MSASAAPPPSCRWSSCARAGSSSARLVDRALLGVRRLQHRHLGRRHAARLDRRERRLAQRLSGPRGRHAAGRRSASIAVVRDRPPDIEPDARHPQETLQRGLPRPVGGVAHAGPGRRALHALLRLRHDADRCSACGRTLPLRRAQARRRRSAATCCCAMGVAQILGILAYGPMDRVLRSRKKVVFAGAAISDACCWRHGRCSPGRRSGSRSRCWSPVCFFCAFGTVIVAQGRTLFPDRLAGRGVTTVNMAQCLGLTVLPAGTGYIVEGASARATSPIAGCSRTLAAGPGAGLDRLRPRARQRDRTDRLAPLLGRPMLRFLARMAAALPFALSGPGVCPVGRPTATTAAQSVPVPVPDDRHPASGPPSAANRQRREIAVV